MRKPNPVEIRYPDLAGDIRFSVEHLRRCCEIDTATGCWLPVRGPRHRQGYAMVGAVRISDGRRIMTTGHRAMMKHRLQQAIPSTVEVYHTCGNPLCVNPDHLAVGTHQDMARSYANQPNRPLRRSRGPDTRPRKPYKSKYSIEDKRFLRHAAWTAIVMRFPHISEARLRQLRYHCRLSANSWLDDATE